MRAVLSFSDPKCMYFVFTHCDKVARDKTEFQKFITDIWSKTKCPGSAPIDNYLEWNYTWTSKQTREKLNTLVHPNLKPLVVEKNVAKVAENKQKVVNQIGLPGVKNKHEK